MTIATTAEVKAALGILDAGQDARLDALIPALDAAIERHVGRTFSAVTTTERLSGGATLMLRALPVISITSITDLHSGQLITDYSVDLVKGLVRRLPFGAIWGDLRAGGPFLDQLGYSGMAIQPRFEVVYQSGYTTVPADVKLALYEAVAFTLAGQGGKTSEKDGDYAYSISAQTGALPATSTLLLAEYRSQL